MREASVRVQAIKDRVAELYPPAELPAHHRLICSAIEKAAANDWIGFENVFRTLGPMAGKYVRRVCSECGLVKENAA
jgi:hypothetical protein